jgi:MIP family channel proteins
MLNLNDAWKAYFAEALGTFWLVTAIAGAVMADALTGGGLGLVGIALALGFGVAAAVFALGHISGAHFNPAVTIAMWAVGKQDAKTSVAYVVSQLVGATIAAAVLVTIFPSVISAATGIGGTFLGAGVSYASGVLAEALLTFILVLTIMGVSDSRNSSSMHGPLAVGFVLAMDVLIGAGITGASMNPARSFGPALLSGAWDSQIVYWIGPIVGGALAAFAYKWLFTGSGAKKRTR